MNKPSYICFDILQGFTDFLDLCLQLHLQPLLWVLYYKMQF